MWALIGTLCVLALILVFVCCLQMAKMSDDEEHDDAILRSILEAPVDAREWARAQPPVEVAPMPAVFRSARHVRGGNAHQRRTERRAA